MVSVGLVVLVVPVVLVVSEYCGGTLTSGVVVPVDKEAKVDREAKVEMVQMAPVYRFMNTPAVSWFHRWGSTRSREIRQ